MTRTDEALMDAFCRSDDTHAYRQIVERYTRRLFKAAYVLMGSTPDCEDAVQDTLVRLVHLRHSYRQGTPFAPWLFAILRYRCIDELRKRKVRAATSLDESIPDHFCTSECVERKESIAGVREALSHLSEQDRLVVSLRIYGEKEFAEIGLQSGLSTDAAKKRYYRALETLKKVLVPLSLFILVLRIW